MIAADLSINSHCGSEARLRACVQLSQPPIDSFLKLYFAHVPSQFWLQKLSPLTLRAECQFSEKTDLQISSFLEAMGRMRQKGL
jgi:hypothetical protein